MKLIMILLLVGCFEACGADIPELPDAMAATPDAAAAPSKYTCSDYPWIEHYDPQGRLWRKILYRYVDIGFIEPRSVYICGLNNEEPPETSCTDAAHESCQIVTAPYPEFRCDQTLPKESADGRKYVYCGARQEFDHNLDGVFEQVIDVTYRVDVRL